MATASIIEDRDRACAAAGAFLIVALADGRYHHLEECRFLTTVANDPAFAFLSTSSLEAAYNATLSAFANGYDGAAARVLALIAARRADARIVAAVTVAARRAIVADARLSPQEEAALDTIAKALGLEAGSV